LFRSALVCLVLAAQAISRLLRRGDDDRRIMRAFGASPLTAAIVGIVGVLLAVALGAVIAFAVAIALSPLAPLGPVRPIYPGAGFAVDWTVLGVGVLVLIGVLGALAFVQSLRGAPHRALSSGISSRPRPRASREAYTAGLPVAGVIGVNFALQPGQGRTQVPVRSVL